MPVNIIICPPFFFRIVGSAALIQLTGAKKLDSNCSRTNVRVRGEAASSSTVPTSAITPAQQSSASLPQSHNGKPSLEQQRSISSLPNASTASATIAWHCHITLLRFPYTLASSFNLSKNSDAQSIKQATRTQGGPSHLPSNSTPLYLSLHPSSSHWRQNSRNSSFRRVLPSSSPPPPSGRCRGFRPATTLSPWASAWRAMAMPRGEVQAVMSQVRGAGWAGKVGWGG